jgi:high-affinity iron transporter
MFAYGIHEFQEAGILPTYYTQVWDTGMIVHENGLLGEILKGVFGYNSDPTLIEVIGYWAYLVFMFLGWGYIERKK